MIKIPKEVSWLKREDLDRMQTDLMIHGDITRAQLAERIVEDAAPIAAYALVDMVSHSEDDNVRLNAAKYLLDRANGKPKTSMQLNVNQDNPVLQVLDGVVVQRPGATVSQHEHTYEEEATQGAYPEAQPPAR